MKKILLSLLVVLMALPAMALDFTYDCEDVKLKYEVIDETKRTVQVTGRASNVSYPENLVIPAEVVYTDSIGNETKYTVVSIGNQAFKGGDFTSVTIPETVTEIGEVAFQACRLTSVTIPEMVNEIGVGAFSNCKSLASITIPESVTKIGKSTFYGCESLNSVTLPEKVTEIGELAFGWSGLSSINIPESVTEIGESAFHTCRLTSVTIPGKVTEIRDRAFGGCFFLTSATINAAKIGDYAFYMCDNLATIIIGESVTEFGEQVFYECPSLVKAEFASIESLCNIKFDYDSNPLTYAHHLFIGGEEVTEVVIPESVTEIGDHTFEGGTGLTSVTIPASVTEIGWEAFSGCSGLTSVTIPASVTEIDWEAFYGCSGLTSVYYAAKEPVSGNANIFASVIYNDATLYVPAEAVAKCKEIDPWKNFANIVAYDFSGLDDVVVEDDAPCEIYNLNGVKLESTESLAPGIYIRRQGSTTEKVLVK